MKNKNAPHTQNVVDIKKISYCSFVTAIMCVCSVIRIDLFFSPVPITLQLFAALTAGILLGGKSAALSMTLYALLGLVGLPVYSGFHAGPGVLFGPAGGFIFGFIFGAFAEGTLHDALLSRNLHKGLATAVSMTVMLIIVYFMGTVQLMLVTKLNLGEALSAGVLPFILPDCFKAFVAWLLVRALPQRLYERTALLKKGGIEI